MSILQKARIQIYQTLNEVGFLRRNKYGTTLFVSDYLQRANDLEPLQKLQSMGYVVTQKNGLLFIDFSHERYIKELTMLKCPNYPREIPHYPLHTLAIRLSRTNTPVAMQPIMPIRMTLLYLEEQNYEKLYRFLSPHLATLLREKQPLPTSIATCIWREFTLRQEETIC